MAALQLAENWVVIPPAVMLVGFLLLLREAARIDAERARRRAAAAARAAGEQRRPARPEVALEEPGADTGETPPPAGLQHSADIIDLQEARTGDQPYDQYDDAVGQAVGD